MIELADSQGIKGAGNFIVIFFLLIPDSSLSRLAFRLLEIQTGGRHRSDFVVLLLISLLVKYYPAKGKLFILHKTCGPCVNS